PGNVPPTVILTTPIAGASFTSPATVGLSASAADGDGSISRVDFYADATLVGSSVTAPYTATWFDAPAGTYSLTARATDDAGAATTSTAVTVLVSAPVVTPPSDPAPTEIVLAAANAVSIVGHWTFTLDTSAASGARMQGKNLGAAKPASASAVPINAFDVTFTAAAGTPYRLWLRGKALDDSYNNDSVFVQFDGSVNATGQPVFRIGTTASTTVILEECSGCGVQGWGWADNGYGVGVLGPAIYFAASGPQRLRIQTREDGLGIDQIVLSAGTYLTTAPGATKNDTTIVTPPFTTVNTAPTVALTTPVRDADFAEPAAIVVSATAADSDGLIGRVEFYAGSLLIGTSTAAPYSVTWSPVAAGTYTLTARALDTNGASTTSAPVVVDVAATPLSFVPQAPVTLRVLQYNTHHGGWGSDGVYSPDRITDWIVASAADLVSLNEIEQFDSWSKNQDQTAIYRNLLRQKTGLIWYMAYVNAIGATSGIGNVVLSKFPFVATDAGLLTGGRAAVDATIAVNGRTINFTSVHMDNLSQGNRLTETTELLSWESSVTENRIIAGDWNAVPDATEIADMKATYTDTWQRAQALGTAAGNGITHGSDRIDYIFQSGAAAQLTLVSEQIYATADASGITPSDHEPVLAVFEVR
ncbi:MAG: Ig-like domain-containing protein, partial [Vicinamibacterales bacterium]